MSPLTVVKVQSAVVYEVLAPSGETIATTTSEAHAKRIAAIPDMLAILRSLESARVQDIDDLRRTALNVLERLGEP